MSRTSEERLALALEHLEILHQHLAKGSLNEAIVLDAVCMRLSAAIDEANHIGNDALLEEFGSQWRHIVDQRNFIAHGYAFVDAGVVQAAVTKDVPQLVDGLRRIRKRMDLKRNV